MNIKSTSTFEPRAPKQSDAIATPAAQAIQRSLKRRYRVERRFRAYGLTAIAIALGSLLVLFVAIVSNGYSAFVQTHFRLEVDFDAGVLDPAGTRDAETISGADYDALVKAAIRREFPEITGRRDRRVLQGLISSGAAFDLRAMVMDDASIIGTKTSVWLPASDDVDMVVKGQVRRDLPGGQGRVSDTQLGWLERLEAEGRVKTRFNTRFFSAGDSREPERAGILGALVGSMYAMLVTAALAFPLGVATAVYLEEFAPRNFWVSLIEVNINNLAAVPSIVFGLLGLAVFLNFFGMPRSAPLVGGMVLALMTLPTVIITARAALGSVPPSIREAAYGLGASPVQVVLHHVLPLSMPGILSGTIIGMARALGETAPLLMIGMVAFIVDIPSAPTDPASVLPVQIFLWADSPERAFVERTSAAIVVLLAFLVAMNGLAIVLRKKLERRW